MERFAMLIVINNYILVNSVIFRWFSTTYKKQSDNEIKSNLSIWFYDQRSYRGKEDESPS
jgi:hypothetical protein